jgi:predicted transposase/invertase (TIGR01784 family)
MSFLNAALELTGRNHITSLEILPNKNLPPETIGDKTSVLDVRARSPGGEHSEHFNIEVQIKNKYNMDRRSLYYWADLYAGEIGRGQDYQELPDVVVINVLDYNYLELEEFHTSFHLWEDRHKDYMLTEAEELHFIELPKYRKLAIKDMNNPLHRWLSFLDQRTPEEEVEEIAKMDAGIAEAWKKMDEIMGDKELRHAYLMYSMKLSDETTMKNRVREEGLAEGKAEGLLLGKEEGKAEGLVEGKAAGLLLGKEEGKAEGLSEASRTIARNLKAQGDPIGRIALVTGLSPEEIEKL